MKNVIGQLGLLGERFDGPVTGKQLSLVDGPCIPDEVRKANAVPVAPAKAKSPRVIEVPCWIVRGRIGQA